MSSELPRDCALLLGIGVLASWDGVVDDIKQFDAAWEANNLVLPDEFFEPAQQVKMTLDDNWKNLEAAIATLAAIEGLDESVRTFYARQQHRAHCNYFAFLEPVATLEESRRLRARGPRRLLSDSRVPYGGMAHRRLRRTMGSNWSRWCPAP